MRKRFFAALAAALVGLLGSTIPVAAQWQTQSLVIKPGWTAVYLFVDASYAPLDNLVGGDPNNPITEVWLWQPNSSAVQFVASPLNPITGNSQWANWNRLGNGSVGASTLASLGPNSAYLIHSTATTNYTWNLKGKPTPPSYYWSSTGINLIGFPTAAANPPVLDNFLALVPSLQAVATVFQYPGGELSAVNPTQIFAPHTVTVSRGRAFWINTPAYANTYFGPFQVLVSGATAFGPENGISRIRLVNPTAGAVTVSLTLQASETPPAGQTPVADVPPMIVRGALNNSDLTYAAVNLTTNTVLSWRLTPQGQAGSDITVILGVNRAALTNNPGAFYVGVLKFTDSRGFTEVDLPVSAQAGSYNGLWIGNATLTQVSNYLKDYQRDANGNPVQDANGTYVVSGVNTNLGAVAAAANFPLRLIVHNDRTNANLLHRVFFGPDPGSNMIIASAESALDPAQLATARRITAVHLPWTPTNQVWPFSGPLRPGATLTNFVSVKYDDQAGNPFLHTYRPDHDNLDATFQNQLPLGAESYQMDRQIILSLAPPGGDFNSLTQFGQSFAGAYAETVTLTGLKGATRTFNTAGAFTLARLSPIATLTRPH